MIKSLFILMLGLIFLQTAKAQKQDSVLLNIRNYGSYNKAYGRIVKEKDSANFILLIKMPPDTSTGVKINAVKESSIGNRLQLTGTAIVYLNSDDISLTFVGPCINFYPNGHRKSIVNYEKNKEVGDMTEYYSNGQLYTLKKYRQNDSLHLIECHDSTGKILSKNGNGNWVKFDRDYRHKTEEGAVKDSLEEGEWHGFINDSVKYTRLYHKGRLVPTTDTAGQIYVVAQRDPQFNDGGEALNHFLGEHIKYPRAARENRVQGKIFISFVIEKDGSLTNVKAIRGNDTSLKDEAIRVIKLSSPWQPGLQNGKAVRVQYTIPITFNLKS